jgi:1-aminocyclopropane-1-carboxylate deaminase/D-cysteine desulfhydrase-like pyridoxal-dependent ACC family enzyme
METLATILHQPTVCLGVWPTPIERVARPGGPDLLVKRDDLSGYGRGGAKTRKIDQILAHLLTRGHDELITTAGNVTNLVFDLLPVLRRHSIRPRIFILDDPPIHARDREAIFEGVRADVELIGRSRAEAAVRMAAAYARGRLAGRRPFVALPGMSHPSAVAANARGFVEMVQQLEASGAPLPSTVFVTAATGTTLAGFLLAEHALRACGRPPIRVVGVQVYPGRVKRSVLMLMRWAERFLGVRSRVPSERIEIEASELHGGFGRVSRALAEGCARVQAETGLTLDPIFGGKTWSAMDAFLRRERRRDEPVLYWHCGYTPEWQKLARAAAGAAEGWAS